MESDPTVVAGKDLHVIPEIGMAIVAQDTVGIQRGPVFKPNRLYRKPLFRPTGLLPPFISLYPP